MYTKRVRVNLEAMTKEYAAKDAEMYKEEEKYE